MLRLCRNAQVFCTKGRILAFFLFISIFSMSLFFSCTNKSVGASLITQFEQVDILISENNYREARVLLKKIEKKAYGVNNRVGVIKRFFLLGEDVLAEEVLKDLLNVYPENNSIRAVYAHYLLRSKRIVDSLSVAKPLKGSDYGSLYTEAVLVAIESLQKEDENYPVIENEEWAQLYLDAFKTTGNDAYRLNAAVLYAQNGEYDRAMLLHPEFMSEYEMPFFWALISYDAKNWYRCLNDLSFAPDTEAVQKLKSDVWVQTKNYKEGEKVWIDLMNQYPKSSQSAYLNASLLYRENGEYEKSCNVLEKGLRYFPQSVGLLTAYGNYALISSKPYLDDAMSAQLRSAGFKTLKMEYKDSIPIVSPQKVIDLIDSAFEESPVMELEVAKTKLKWEVLGSSREKRCSDMWLLFEKYGQNAVLSRYAVWLFAENGFIDDAQHLLRVYMLQNEKLAIADYEMAAFTAALAKDFDKAIALYQKIPGIEGEPFFVSSVPAILNLGALYCAGGNRFEALALYEKALDVVEDQSSQAELYYRMAAIQLAFNNEESAAHLLHYCLKKNPVHYRARLLQKKITQ